MDVRKKEQKREKILEGKEKVKGEIASTEPVKVNVF